MQGGERLFADVSARLSPERLAFVREDCRQCRILEFSAQSFSSSSELLSGKREKSVCSSVGFALTIVNPEVETRELLGPTDLSGAQSFCIHKTTKVVMAREYEDQFAVGILRGIFFMHLFFLIRAAPPLVSLDRRIEQPSFPDFDPSSSQGKLREDR